jgi:hypothetical protein
MGKRSSKRRPNKKNVALGIGAVVVGSLVLMGLKVGMDDKTSAKRTKTKASKKASGKTEAPSDPLG